MENPSRHGSAECELRIWPDGTLRGRRRNADDGLQRPFNAIGAGAATNAAAADEWRNRPSAAVRAAAHRAEILADGNDFRHDDAYRNRGRAHRGAGRRKRRNGGDDGRVGVVRVERSHRRHVPASSVGRQLRPRRAERDRAGKRPRRFRIAPDGAMRLHDRCDVVAWRAAERWSNTRDRHPNVGRLQLVGFVNRRLDADCRRDVGLEFGRVLRQRPRRVITLNSPRPDCPAVVRREHGDQRHPNRMRGRALPCHDRVHRRWFGCELPVPVKKLWNRRVVHESDLVPVVGADQRIVDRARACQSILQRIRDQQQFIGGPIRQPEDRVDRRFRNDHDHSVRPVDLSVDLRARRSTQSSRRSATNLQNPTINAEFAEDCD